MKLNEPISITAIASISPMGGPLEEAWAAYKDPRHLFKQRKFGGKSEWVAPIPESAAKKIIRLKESDPKYKSLDDSVLFAIYASRNAIKLSGWSSADNFGINIGSSRGATSLFEKYHNEYLDQNRTSALSSPTTTLGNISSWVAHDLQTQGPEISHSITCSTALHAMLNGIAWIKGGMCEKFLVGGSEAPLTSFTISQMKALKIYTQRSVRVPSGGTSFEDFPCQALNLDKKQNSMILGEGASMACLEKGVSKKALAIIEGMGYATEVLEHNTSISADAKCFRRSMEMALGDTGADEVDAIVMHAPGTIKGDLSEFRAIQNVFGENLPALTTTKWKTGHTFGASGMLSIELAILMLQNQEFVGVPFVDNKPILERINRVLVNAVGFGGNAVSILLKNPLA